MDAQDKERIIAITTQIVMGRVAKGEVDPEDEQALRAATKEAAQTAKAAYFAALDFLK